MIQNAATDSPARHSRYTCTGSPPEHLENILRALEQRMRKNRPFSGDSKEMRGFLASVNGYYRNKGQADDCVRFLKNVGILLVDPSDDSKKTYADIYRHAEILEACKAKRVPTDILPDQTDGVRVAKIKDWIAEAQLRATDSNPPSAALSSQAPVSECELVLTGKGMEGTEEILMLVDGELKDYYQRLEQARAKITAEMCAVRAEQERRLEEARLAEVRRRLESLRVAKQAQEEELRKKQAELQELGVEIAKLESELSPALKTSPIKQIGFFCKQKTHCERNGVITAQRRRSP